MLARLTAFATLALVLPKMTAEAQSVNVSISAPSVDVANLVLTSPTASVRIGASSGAVSFPSGTVARIKRSGVNAGNAASQTVTITCSGAGSDKCVGKTLRVFVTQVTGSISEINFSNVGATVGAVTGISATSGQAAPSATTPLFTATAGGNGNDPFTLTFRLGSTASVNRTPAGVATWTYNVRATVQ